MAFCYTIMEEKKTYRNPSISGRKRYEEANDRAAQFVDRAQREQ